MASTLSRALVLAALLAATPLLSRQAVAQCDDSNVRAMAFVTGSVQVFGLRADATHAAPRQDVRQVTIAGVGALEVQAAPGAVTRIVPREARVMRVTIDFVAN